MNKPGSCAPNVRALKEFACLFIKNVNPISYQDYDFLTSQVRNVGNISTNWFFKKTYNSVHFLSKIYIDISLLKLISCKVSTILSLISAGHQFSQVTIFMKSKFLYSVRLCVCTRRVHFSFYTILHAVFYHKKNCGSNTLLWVSGHSILKSVFPYKSFTLHDIMSYIITKSYKSKSCKYF